MKSDSTTQPTPSPLLRSVRGIDTRFIAFVAVIVAGVWGISALANSIGASSGSSSIDQRITEWLFGNGNGNGFPFGSHQLADVARDVTALGSAFILTLLIVTIVPWIFVRKDRLGGFFLIAVVLGATLLSFVLKVLIARERPDFASSYVFETSASFPSGHSLLSAALYPALAVIAARRERPVFVRLLFQINALLIVLLVGISRVLLGAHYPTDVLAGWTAGFCWVALCRIGLSYVERYAKRRGEKEISSETVS